MASIQEKIRKYAECVKNDSKMRNQIVVKDGKSVLFIEGRKSYCEKVEGFIKLPGDEHVELIETQNVSICILPKRRLIVERGGEYYLGGYKKDNTVNCFLMIHAVTETDDVLVVWLGDEKTPICILMGDGELEENSIGTIFYKVVSYMLLTHQRHELVINDIEQLEGGDFDEFE